MKGLKKEAIIEFEIKKSKFIGYIKPITSKKEAEEFIINIKRKHRDATHNCSAYKVIDNGQEVYKTDDDGEPSGTAGKPMGEILNLMGIENVVVVVTRYYGGVKLGAGGLIRNYAKTVKLAVEAGGVEELVEKIDLVIEFGYERSSEMDNLLSGSMIMGKEYGERILYRVRVDEGTAKELEKIRNIVVIRS